MAKKGFGFKPKENGGVIRGPGTGTSDSIATEMQPGTYIMPADSTRTIGDEALKKMADAKVPVRVSNGEFEFTPEQVQSIGAAVLTALRDATHKPVDKPAGQQPKGFYSGGQVGMTMEGMAFNPLAQEEDDRAQLDLIRSQRARLRPAYNSQSTSATSNNGGAFAPLSGNVRKAGTPDPVGDLSMSLLEKEFALEQSQLANRIKNTNKSRAAGLGGLGVRTFAGGMTGGMTGGMRGGMTYANGGSIQPRGFQPFQNGGLIKRAMGLFGSRQRQIDDVVDKAVVGGQEKPKQQPRPEPQPEPSNPKFEKERVTANNAAGISFADGGLVEIEQDGSPVRMGSLEPLDSNQIVGRRQTAGPGKKEYNEQYGFGPGTGRGAAPFDFRTGKKNEGYREGFRRSQASAQGFSGGGLVRDDELAASGMMSNDGTFIPEYKGGKNRMGMYGSTMRGNWGLANGGPVPARGFQPQRFSKGGEVEKAYEDWQAAKSPWYMPTPRGNMEERNLEAAYNKALANAYTASPQVQPGAQPPAKPAAEPERTPQYATLASVEGTQNRNPAPQAKGFDPEQAPKYFDRTKMTNAQVAEANPEGRVKVTRNADGTMEFSGNNVRGAVSYNDANGNALPGGGINGKGFSGFEVAPAGSNVAMGPNGSYAYATSGSGTRTPEKVQQDIAQSKLQTADRAKQLGVDVNGMTTAQAEQYMAQVQAARENARSAQAIAGGSKGAWENFNDMRSHENIAARNFMVSANSTVGGGGRVGRGGDDPADPGNAKKAGSLHGYQAVIDSVAKRAAGEPSLAENQRQFDAQQGLAVRKQDAGERSAEMAVREQARQTQRKEGMEDQTFATASENARLELAAAQRKAAAFDAYAKATPEARAQVAAQFPDLFPRSEPKNLNDNFMRRKVAVLDEQGRPTGAEREEIVDLRTSRVVNTDGGQNKPLPAPKDVASREIGPTYISPNGKLVKWTGEGWIPA